MPPTATYNDIRTYQEKVEKDKITPHSLPPCPRCQVESRFFKLHAYRERRFLIIVEVLVKAVLCTLVRFRCPDCGKTVTCYPDFAIAQKHYTRQSIEGFSRAYVQDDHKTYEDAVMTDDGIPERPVSGQTLAPSSVHRWISTVAGLTCDGMKKLLSKKSVAQSFENLDLIQIPERKYKSPQRKHCLLVCRCFFKTVAFLNQSDFTDFAIKSV
jgi:hypothetical protein